MFKINFKNNKLSNDNLYSSICPSHILCVTILRVYITHILIFMHSIGHSNVLLSFPSICKQLTKDAKVQRCFRKKKKKTHSLIWNHDKKNFVLASSNETLEYVRRPYWQSARTSGSVHRVSLYVPRGNPSMIFDSWTKKRKKPARVRDAERTRGLVM